VVIVAALAVGLIILLKRRNGTSRKGRKTYDSGSVELSARLNELEEEPKGYIPQTTSIRYPDPDEMDELAGGRTQTHN
jgi:hypothetical protein